MENIFGKLCKHSIYLLFPNPDFVFLLIVIVTFVNFRRPLYHVQIFCIFGDIDTFYPIIFVHRLAWLGSAIVNTLTWVVADIFKKSTAKLAKDFAKAVITVIYLRFLHFINDLKSVSIDKSKLKLGYVKNSGAWEMLDQLTVNY